MVKKKCRAAWCKAHPPAGSYFTIPRPPKADAAFYLSKSSKRHRNAKRVVRRAEKRAEKRAERLALIKKINDEFMIKPPYVEKGVYCKAHCELDTNGEPIEHSILHYSRGPIYNSTSGPRRDNEAIDGHRSMFSIPPSSSSIDSGSRRVGGSRARADVRATGGSLASAAERVLQLGAELGRAKSERGQAESERGQAQALLAARRVGYKSLLEGELTKSCRAWTNLEPGGLECLVESMLATGMGEAYAEVASTHAHHKNALLDLGMEDAVTLVMVKCALGVNNTILADLFGLRSHRVSGDAFKLTLFICCFWAEQTLAVVPDLAQLREDALPAFKNATFMNALLTFDATNTNINKPSNTQGRRETFSDYYAANCAKWEMVSTIDGTPAWVSYTFGGRASERDIMCGSDWKKFFHECTDKWELKGKKGERIPIVCLMDKGTRMEQEVKKEGGKSLTPTQLKDNFVSLKGSKRNEHVSKARGHVERAIGRVKRNRILEGAFSHAMLPLLDDILFFCVFSTLLVAPTEKGEGGGSDEIAACFPDGSESESEGESGGDEGESESEGEGESD